MAKKLKKAAASQQPMMSEEEMRQMETMVTSPAYMDKKHADHRKTVAAVSGGYKKGFKRNKR